MYPIVNNKILWNIQIFFENCLNLWKTERIRIRIRNRVQDVFKLRIYRIKTGSGTLPDSLTFFKACDHFNSRFLDFQVCLYTVPLGSRAQWSKSYLTGNFWAFEAFELEEFSDRDLIRFAVLGKKKCKWSWWLRVWDLWLNPVLRIRDILVRIRIRGSVPLTNGSGSGSCCFRQWPSRWRWKLKNILFAFYFLKLHLHHFQR